MQRNATSVYPSRPGAFPPATFFTYEAQAAYMREVQSYPGVFGICACPALSFELQKSWWGAPIEKPNNTAD
ncbi:hypothetical protein ACK249_003612 [Pseudomonas aeruginosa]|uniref:hypothetical protein n=1 Tax=Pseudomonas aeruginosa TaxID=287 RepID=UPI0025C8BEC6|nr:hypothetical protein [Pseudomonas aeruginosa]EKW9641061.1 hypothetical protein [Pseudomonas aeruginosa]